MNLFFRFPVWMKVFNEVGRLGSAKTITEICKALEFSYAPVCQSIKALETKHMVIKEKKGRIVSVSLTEGGKQTYELLTMIISDTDVLLRSLQ